jgi:putative IMPACT (imprinted ancient) family translation regulator
VKIQEALQTILSETSGVYAEKGSKFLSFAVPVTEEQAVKTRREQLRKEHYKAVHVVVAYRLGEAAAMEYSSDDGEPSGSAGRPVLNELKSRQLTNVAVFIVRYYGGKKLGVAGLINAYKSACIAALDIAETRPLEVRLNFRIICPAAEQHVVVKWIADVKAIVENTSYGNTCEFLLSIDRSELNALEQLKRNWQIEVESVEEKSNEGDEN